MGHDMSAAADNDKISSKGGAWIGIDLGTTNCTAAVSLYLMLNCVYYSIIHILCFYSHITTNTTLSVTIYLDHGVKYLDLDTKI